MSSQPSEPEVRFCWVHGPARIGSPVPGLIVSWQAAPVHNATSSAWVALVATNPVADSLHLEYVSGERVVLVRDATPLDGPS